VLELTPGNTRLRLGAKQRFKSSLPVTWSVVEPNGGSIDASGEYRAPLRPGTYHVRARTPTGVVASASIVVGPTKLEHTLGLTGGLGSADGIGRDARFSMARSIVGDAKYLYVSDGYLPTKYEFPCKEQCEDAADPDGCALGHAEFGPIGVRRVSRSTDEVEWLVRDRLLVPLTLHDDDLFAGTASVKGHFSASACKLELPKLATSIVRVDPQTGALAPLAGTDAPGPPHDGVAGSARFQDIRGMVAHQGKLYLTEYAGALREVDLTTGQVRTLAAGPGWTGEALVQAGFGRLEAITQHGGQLFAIDNSPEKHWRLWRYDLGTATVEEQWTVATPELPYDWPANGVCFIREDSDYLLASTPSCLMSGKPWSAPEDCHIGHLTQTGFDDGSIARFTALLGIWCPGDVNDAFVADRVTVRSVSFVAPGQGADVNTLAGEPSHEGPETSIPAGPQMRLAAPVEITGDAAGTVVVRQHLGEDLVRITADGKVATYGLPGAHGMALGPSGRLYLNREGRVYALDLGKAFDQHAPFSAAASLLSLDDYERIVHDGAGTLYAKRNRLPGGCSVARIDPTSGTPEVIADWDATSPLCSFRLAAAGGSQLFMIEELEWTMVNDEGWPRRNRVLSLDLASGNVAALPIPFDGWQVSALAYDPAGVLYVAEGGRQRIRGLIVETGEVFDVVGKQGSQGVQLGLLPASLNNPRDIALLPDGSLAIADYDENVVLVAR
jgi:DNA-binding beta-propeller fold protein YncE